MAVTWRDGLEAEEEVGEEGAGVMTGKEGQGLVTS